MSHKQSNRLLWLALTLSTYLLALILPAFSAISGFDLEGTPHTHSGLHILTMGWLAVLDGTVAWYANLFWLGSLLANKKSPRVGAYLAVIGLMIGLTGLFYKSIWSGPGDPRTFIVEYHAGVYFWYLSFLFAFIYALAFPKSRPENPPING